MKTSIAYTFALLLCVAGMVLAQEGDTTTQAAPATYGWTYRTFTMDEIRMHPARTLEGLMIQTPGITRVNSSLYARGSRTGEVEYRFGGMPALDRWTNTNAVPYIPEMLENVTIHTGAYGPDLGSMGGGVVDMKLREGGEAFNVEASFLTDDFANPGSQFLNTSSYGWTTAVVTLGTPLPFDSRLFVATEISKQANRAPMYLEPINIVLDPDPVSGSNYRSPTEPFVIGRNHVPSQSADRTVIQWNLTSRYAGPLIEFFGSVSSDRSRNVTWPTAVVNFFRQSRISWWEHNATYAALRVSEEVLSGLRLSGAVAYARERFYTSDPDLGESWRLYADSAANAAVGYPEFTSRYSGPTRYSSILYFSMEHGSAPTNSYQQESSRSWNAFVQADLDISDSWKAKLTGVAEWWTLRRFVVASISSMGWLDYNGDGVVDQTFTSEHEERLTIKSAMSITNFGYTYRGSETDDGIDAPRKPSIVSAAISTSWRDEGFSVDIGLRAQWMSLAMSYPPMQPNPITGGTDWQNLDEVWDYNLRDFRDETLTTTPVESYLLPRVSVRYDLSGGRIFASHGEYVETIPHRDLQLEDHWLSILLDPLRRVPYNIGGPIITFQVRPSRTSHTEIGAEVMIAQGIALSGVAYHKSMKGQVQMGRLPHTLPEAPPIVALANTGESNASGIEVGIQLEATQAIGMGLSYAWSLDQGLGSHPRSNKEYFTDEYYPGGALPPPPMVRPLDYSRTHRILANLSFIPDNESILYGLQVRALATLESGTPYTREFEKISGMGSAGVWTIGMRSYQDVRTFNPVEPTNASRTPWISSVDFSLSHEFDLGPARLTVFTLVTNIFDTKNVLNVYSRTSSPTSDGWLESEFAPNFVSAFPQYGPFYRAINLQNRWAYMSVTGNDIYGTPRQIRVGMEVGI